MKGGLSLEKPLHPVLTIRLFRDDRGYGPGIDTLLQGVKEYHSLRAAAQSMGMAYSKAWTTVRRCEEALGFPLLISAVGGRNGGGASLTPEAEALMDAYHRYCSALRQTADEMFQQEFKDFIG